MTEPHHDLPGAPSDLPLVDGRISRLYRQYATAEPPAAVDQHILAAARAAEDERIVAYVDGLTEGALAATFSYRTIASPQDITQPLAPALSHVFNHQTHHRGQAHSLVSQAAGNAAAPSLDLILYQRETGIGLS